jgi:hypothetical protein
MSIAVSRDSPAPTPSNRHVFFDSVHVSTYLSAHDAPKTFNVTQDGIAGRLRTTSIGPIREKQPQAAHEGL